ncbi:NUDIX domain-containing protein [Desulfopila sp. IMCC35006]|uniref:NUDIX hydrolase n=1 Tax=Desulfopila sp. IMCC35006 TaxID=2569542 RepID=UPI0010ACFFC3|nr:NUDIX domain-containing protein [Desulfopila sp. IMCC35006]TKB23993.1 NUDIX domain-containing protein [Desulfopila sp. IMCC35006]
MGNESRREIFDIVDEHDKVTGQASRQEVHNDPSLIHRVVHVLVFNPAGELFLQKRSPFKDVHPGKWDTSVGGHVEAGESYEHAALREMKEELGIQETKLEFLHTYLHRNSYESEFVRSYRCCWDGSVRTDPKEIAEGRFWSLKEINDSDQLLFTPNFLDELKRFKNLCPSV